MPFVLPFALVRKLQALEDLAVRRGVLATTLAELDDRSVSLFLAFLAEGLRDPGYRSLYLDVVLTLLAPGTLDDDRRAAILARLDDDPRRPVFQFLAIGPDERRGAGAGRAGAYAFEEVPLGLRKARARQRNRDTLRLLAEDPDPSVIRILLENPVVVESDALKVAARRPQTPATFLEVLGAARWGVREAVQAAVVLNPWCSVRVAVAAVPLVVRARLQEVAGSQQLDERVRAAAWAMLAGASG